MFINIVLHRESCKFTHTWFLCCCLASKLYPTLFATPWTVARQAPLSVGFPRQAYWSGLPFPSPGDLPDPGIKPEYSALAGGFFTAEPWGKPINQLYLNIMEKEIATHSHILAWEIPWTEESGGLQSMGSQRAARDWTTNTHTSFNIKFKKLSYGKVC